MATVPRGRLSDRESGLVGNDPITWSDQHGAGYRLARSEIIRLQPGQALLYHEGMLALDVLLDGAVAGRAAAFRDAALTRAEGTLVQRRLRAGWYQYLFLRSE